MRSHSFREWKRDEEGGAAAEFAVLVFVLGPLWMFTMFASDAVQHLMDVQEAVITTTWDLSQVQYGGNVEPDPDEDNPDALDPIQATVKMSRLQFADHDSSFINEGNISGGKFNGDAHHVNAFAHTCWCNGGGGSCDAAGQTNHTDRSQSHQVYCRKTGKNKVISTTLTFNAMFNRGDIYECAAKGWLFNYALPETFVSGIPGNERIPLFNKRKRSDGIDNKTAHVQGDSTADLLLREHAAIMTDPWAITELKRIDPGRDHHVPIVMAGETNSDFNDGGDDSRKSRYYARAQWEFYLGGTWFAQPAMYTAQFALKAFQNQILVCPSVPPLPRYGVSGFPFGLENPLGLWMNAQWPEPGTNDVEQFRDKDSSDDWDGDGEDKYYTTPFLDGSAALKAYRKRGPYYLGRCPGSSSTTNCTKS